MLRVKITKTRGEFSTPDVLIVEEGTIFKAGTILDIGVQTWRIRAIHTGEGRTLRGTVDASKIKRMYLHEPPRPERFEPKTPRERRQAWKEGRLGFNPNPILPKSKSRSGSSRQISARRKRPESDYGRFVQGIKNALAICNPMVGFSCSRRMLYSYHFSPYGM